MTSHTKLSYVKSGFRIFAFTALGNHAFLLAGLVLIVAELIGIVEEFPSMYRGTKIQ